MERSQLAEVRAEMFYEGMYVDSEIYHKYHNRIVPLSDKIVIDRFMLIRLHQLELTGQRLYVKKSYFADFSELSFRFSKTILSETKDEFVLLEKYQAITVHTAALLKSIEELGTVPVEESKKISQQIREQMEKADTSMILQFMSMIRRVDSYLYTHSTNVAILNGMIGRWLHLSQDEIDRLIVAGLLHDVGKIRIPKEILNKPSRLSNEEYDQIKDHAAFSWDMLRASGITDEAILSGVRGHHERLNGMGYPDRLQGETVHSFARITAISDVYDAMVSERPYKECCSPFEILSIFSTKRFSDLDIEVANTFLNNIADELVGRTVVLSDGRKGKVAYISRQNFAYPLVDVDGELVSTNETLKCESLEAQFSLNEQDMAGQSKNG